MGCIVTKPEEQPQGSKAPEKPKAGEKGKAPQSSSQSPSTSKNKTYQDDKKDEKKSSPAEKSKSGAAAGGGEEDPEFAKQMKDFGAGLFSQASGKEKEKKFYVCCVAEKDSLEFGCANASTAEMFSSTFGESDLAAKKGEKTTWPVLFKSIKQAFNNGKVSLKDSQSGMSLSFSVEGSGRSSVSLTLKGISGSSGVAALHRLFLEPMCNWFTKRRGSREETKYLRAEQEINAKLASCGEHQQRITQLEAELEPLQKSAKQASDDAVAAKEQCDGVAKRIAQLKNPTQRAQLYPDGPVRFVLHTQHAKEHHPRSIDPNRSAMYLIRQKYGGDTSISVPEVEGDQKAILETLAKIDQWDFDVFRLQELTKGGSLFMTTYCLMYKYGLVQHFKINEEILIHFLQAVESGYHPNPYHNSTHAADVLQITHYIVSPGGMAEHIKMTKEDMLAALLSACIHDYDHPGFNNNFHCRTNAYLATLYNDRSVLENHHLAQVFDLMKTPKYNVLGSLTEEQRKDVRDTMVEMVLSTDMGNHAKIFQQFRKRLGDDPEWSRKEDQRLALTIAIKMADISNCGRPQDLYLRWAKCIADEFYNQGDVEAKLKFTISPFMDRRKDKTDFSKGQISFMNYIVIPLFEAGSQFLTKLEFTVENIHQNRDYWQKREGEGSG